MNLSNLKLRSLSPERFFVVFASVFGLIFMLITPPFQSPDEVNHFYKAYQISEGTFISVQQNDRVGGFIPTSIVNVVKPAERMFGNMHQKANSEELTAGFNTALNAEDKTFVDFPNTAIYSPISYAPQAAILFVLRQFNLPPLYLFYGARLASLIFWLVCIFLAIRLMPFYKWFFAFLALLPMSIFANMSMSADVVTNAVSFITIAYFLHLAIFEPIVTKKQFIIALGLAVLITSVKFVYAPILLLFLLIPVAKFDSRKRFIFQLGLLFFLAVITTFFWSSVMGSLYLPYSEYNPNFRDGITMVDCANIQEQLHYILSNGGYIFKVFYNSMIGSFDMYFQGYIGTFGWLDTFLPMWMIYAAYFVLFIVSILDGTSLIVLKLRHKLVLFSAFVIILLLILLTQHLAWDCVGGNIINNLQGRYFIPVVPLFLLLFYSPKYQNRKVLVPLIIGFSFVSLSVSVNTLYDRYYVPADFNAVTIKCGGEQVNSNGSFKSSNNDVELKGGAQNKDVFRSGSASIELTPEKPFGCSHQIKGGRKGDRFRIDAWRKGSLGDVVISAGTDGFYLTTNTAVESDNLGWEKIAISIILKEDLGDKELRLYLLNPSKSDTVYFDDIEIGYDILK